MDQEDFNPSPPPAESADPAPLFVSLYTVLLAFFILLNSITSYEEKKTQEAAISVALAFDYKVTPFSRSTTRDPEDVPSQGLSVAKYFSEMTDANLYHYPIQMHSSPSQGETMSVTIPLAELFAAESQELRPKAQAYLAQIASITGHWSERFRIDAETLLSYPGDELSLFSSTDEGARLAIRRAGVLARYLRGRGLDPRQIAPGVQADDRDAAVLTFTPRLNAVRLELKHKPTN